jgi:hypothetical protein
VISNAGELVDHIKVAVEQHGAGPHSEVRVRLGKFGPVYRIEQLNGVRDQRGFSLLLELNPIPESTG